MSARLRHGLVEAACGMIAATRADLWLGPIVAGPGLVLTMHRVRPRAPSAFAPNAGLEITPEALEMLVDEIAACGLDVIGIDDVFDRLRKPTGRGFVVLTFDDGYRDNLDYAAPIFAARSLPWTLFVVSDFLRGEGIAWWLELEMAVASLEIIAIAFGGKSMVLRSRTLAEKERAFAVLRRMLHGATHVERLAVLDDLRVATGLDRKRLIATTFASAAEIARAKAGNALTIGSHTMSHPVLSRCTGPEAAREIAGSKAELEALFGCTIEHIAFPHGDRASIGARESLLAAEAGYVAAWTTRAAHLSAMRREDAWSLPRISLNGHHQSRAMFRAILSGTAFPMAALRRQGPMARAESGR